MIRRGPTDNHSAYFGFNPSPWAIRRGTSKCQVLGFRRAGVTTCRSGGGAYPGLSRDVKSRCTQSPGWAPDPGTATGAGMCGAAGALNRSVPTRAFNLTRTL